jgi:hypothetical protein
MTVENGPAWAGLATLLITQLTGQWREERRHRQGVADRAEAERKAVEERSAVEASNRAEREQAEEAASRERRRVMRHLREIRPDPRCQARGCPLAYAAPAHPALKERVTMPEAWKPPSKS